MKTAHTAPERQVPHSRWPRRYTDFVTPLPARRERKRDEPPLPTLDWEPWQRAAGYREIRGPLRGIAVLILWLFVVLCLILLMAQFAV